MMAPTTMGRLAPLGALAPLVALAVLLPILTLAPLATAAGPIGDECPKNSILIQYESFRWQWDTEASKTGNTSLMQVTATSTCDDKLPNTDILLLDVALVYTSKAETLINVVGNGSIASPTSTFYFLIDVDTIDFEKDIYYVISATVDFPPKSSGISKIGWEAKTVNGVAKFKMEVTPGLIKGHHLTPLNYYRLSDTGNLALVDCTSVGDDAAACSFPTAGEEEPDVCVTQSAIETDGDGSILICDDTVQFIAVSELTDLDSVQLIYKDKVVVITQTDESTKLELYNSANGIYEACGTPVMRPAICKMRPFTPSNKTYVFKMVQLNDEGYPLSSREVDVQDFNVATVGISSDTAQVSWDSGSYSDFNVTISPALSATYSSRVVTCTQPTCDFFFIGLPQSWTTYSAIVRSVDGGNFTSEVVASLADTPPGIISDMHDITKLNHYTDDGYKSIHTEACFAYSGEEPSMAHLLLIDSTGLFVQSNEGVLNNFNNTHCFKSVTVPGEFVTDDPTRILVEFTTDDGSFSTQMDIFLFTPDIHQVSNTSARATWRNLNSAEFFSSRAPGYEDRVGEQQLECSYTGDRCYYYVNEDEPRSSNFSLLEKSEKLDQSSTVQLKMEKIPTWLDIVSPFSVRSDDRLQVCFTAVPNVSRYELGIEILGDLVSSNQNASVAMVSGKTCAVSTKPVAMGAYEELWAVVVAYDAAGAILSAGETQYQDTFLSPNRFVLAVTSGFESPVSLKASWYILDDTSAFKIYNTRLVDANGATLLPRVVVMPDSSTDFSIDKEGLYSVCVSATTPTDTESEQTCSDIVTVKFSQDISDSAPIVQKVQHFYTSDMKLKLSWDRPTEASALFVSWSGDESRHVARNGRSLSSIESARSPSITSRPGSEVAAVSARKVDVPLPKARAIQSITDQTRRVVLPDIAIDGDGFTMVPASQSSLDIPLATGAWDICVSAVRNQRTGEEVCLNATLEDDGAAISPPTDLAFAKGVLSWQGPSGDAAYSYYVECDGGSESLSVTTEGTSLALDVLGAGQWTVAVHSVNSTSRRLSDGQTIVIVIEGTKVTYEQTGHRDVLLSWEETSETLEDEMVTYTVTLEGEEPGQTTCSRATGCSVTFVDVTANQSQLLTVTVASQNNQTAEEELQIFFLDIGSVSASALSRELNANGSATVRWDCLEGVSFYSIRLVGKDDVVLVNTKQTIPCSYTFDEAYLTNPEETYVLLQACLNTPGVVRCGAPQKLYLGPDDATTDSSVLVIVLASVGAGLLVILMVAGLVYKLRRDRAKQDTEDDTFNGEGSVHSDSGSQHSVEPSTPQPRAALQSNAAQNSLQPSPQRLTPVPYQSAASAPRRTSQIPPSNGAFELSASALQNPAAARAPLSSVNPNIRYDGPAQRNVLSNPGPQRLHQVGNPPLQRFSGPQMLAPNPNVRVAGAPRMNVPAGQSRMNSVPSGPRNFGGQPRNLIQGGGVNRRPNSQPIEVIGRFSGTPIPARPAQMYSARAPAPRPTARYPPQGQRSAPRPSSPTRLQALPPGPRPIPRVGGGGYADAGPSHPGARQARSGGRQFSPERERVF